jgi:hypothetical protein
LADEMSELVLRLLYLRIDRLRVKIVSFVTVWNWKQICSKSNQTI